MINSIIVFKLFVIITVEQIESGGCIGKNTPESVAKALTLNQLSCLQQMLQHNVVVPEALQMKLKGILNILSSKNDTVFESSVGDEDIDEFDLKAMQESSVALKARQIFGELSY